MITAPVIRAYHLTCYDHLVPLTAITSSILIFTLQLGVPVCNALLAFGEERYDEVYCTVYYSTYKHPHTCMHTHTHLHTHTQVLQIMLPLRYDFRCFGGSWAQRQVFNVTMIQAAINANETSVALALVGEMTVSIDCIVA